MVLTQTDLRTIVIGVSVVVLSAGSVAFFRWLARWIARSITDDLRAAVRQQIVPVMSELQANGGKSMADRLVSRIDGVGAEVAFLTKRIGTLTDQFEAHESWAVTTEAEIRQELEANGNGNGKGKELPNAG